MWAAAMTCVVRFSHGPDAVAQLAVLKKASSYERSDMIEKSGWGRCPVAQPPLREPPIHACRS
jgi:hypothetical protein